MYQFQKKKTKRHSLHNTYYSMRGRCLNKNNPSYKNYGGRGIEICKEWLGDRGFTQFVKDVGVKPTLDFTLDRINNSKGYNPSNIKWSTRKQQNNNMRSNNKVSYVYWWRIRKRWRVVIDDKYIGIFKYYTEAVKVRNNYVSSYYCDPQNTQSP